MGTKASSIFSSTSALLQLTLMLTGAYAHQHTTLDIRVERIERVSRSEVRFSLIVTNRSKQSVFLTAVNYESGPRLNPVRLEQWVPQEGWKRSSCSDTPPPDIIKLNPGDTHAEALSGKLPISGACKNPITDFAGKFRFRLEYFDSEKQARAYVKKLFSSRWHSARAPVAFSEPFEIPSKLNEEQ